MAWNCVLEIALSIIFLRACVCVCVRLEWRLAQPLKASGLPAGLGGDVMPGQVEQAVSFSLYQRRSFTASMTGSISKLCCDDLWIFIWRPQVKSKRHQMFWSFYLLCLSVFVEACQCLLTVFMLHPWKILINTSCSVADSHFCHSRLTKKTLFIKSARKPNRT